MNPINFDALFWIWLNPTSAGALVGDAIAGGQTHVAFGRSGDDLDAFMPGQVSSTGGRGWQIPLEAYGDIRPYVLTIAEMAPGRERAGECRLTGQAPNSDDAYPLWSRVVTPIPPRSRARQLFLVLREQITGRFHARVLESNDLHRLPDEVVRFVLEAHGSRGQHVAHLTGVFEDLSTPAQPTTPPSVGEHPSGSVEGGGISAPAPLAASSWEGLARRVQKIEQQSARFARRYMRAWRYVRDRRVRNLALTCFGARCQVRGCVFTAGLSEDHTLYVLEVHHLQAVARGGADTPFNLSVLCANHHRLCERLPGARALDASGTDDIVVVHDSGSFLIERDLDALRAALANL